MKTQTKKCGECKRSFPKLNAHGLCGSCYVRKWRNENPGARYRHTRKARLRDLYGMTEQDYDEMLAGQKGKCAICGTKKCSSGYRFAVDHDHKTGVVRGLLCRRCNQAIGQLNEIPELFEKAAGYLRRSGFARNP